MPAPKTHGFSDTRLYRIWRGMITRCYDERNDNFSYYGGRGIRVDAYWHDLRIFVEWAVNNGYSDELMLERIDNEGHYTPTNCTWATRTTQANNRRSTRLITIHGETKSITQWSQDVRCKVSYYVLRDRLNKGCDPIIALTAPHGARNLYA
jgi:hypothetical protein